MKKVFLIATFIILVNFYTNEARANCSPSPVTTTVSLTPATITVPPQTQPGQPIGPAYGPFNASYASLGNCGFVPYMYLAFNTPLTPTAYANIYATSVPGVGVKVWTSFISLTYVGNTPTYWYLHNSSGGAAGITGIYIQFYSIGNMTSGRITLPNPLVKAMTSTSQVSPLNTTIYNYLAIGNQVSVNAPTCTIGNPDQTVQLPQVNGTDLRRNGPGRYPAKKSFTINFTCTPGMLLQTKFEGTAMSGNNDVLANTESGNDNVGIQMVYNNSPVTLGQNLTVTNNAQASQIMNLDSYYFYKGGSLTSGQIKTVTTFTISYN
ncbi:fimbrial protein [Enterobacter sp. CC120223-11]|uniref:fimbrial protein n=1 Tax=Enterobacter sp. CC120223-11 TaxID=1378073 RepID=UPI000BC42E44|nr:fimbrial protein [Enterobacter sp. CC120223-11]SNY79615.1 Pilin (type 1 fimbria component protein) [Enterobacter sp. CC120223-11]